MKRPEVDLPPGDFPPSAPSRTTRRELLREAEACSYVVDLVYERSRVRLHDGKQALIRARLGKRVRLHGFTCLADYCDWLRESPDSEEITHVVDALTTNFTNFLREEDHFRFLVQEALPARLGSRRRFVLWSSACSTGEEPYSLAFYLESAFPVAEGWDWRILATDISTRALAKARAGIYPADRLEPLSPGWRRAFFQQGHGRATGLYRVKSRIRERLEFRHVNLLELPDIAETFEAILCRNVMIYFDRPTQQQLVASLASHLAPGGFLLIGHSESLVGLPLPFRCLRPSYYQKR